jgi:hypothetical protein
MSQVIKSNNLVIDILFGAITILKSGDEGVFHVIIDSSECENQYCFLHKFDIIEKFVDICPDISQKIELV